MLLVFLALEIGRSVVPIMTWATWREGSACWGRTYFVGNILSLACELSFTEGGGFWRSGEISVTCSWEIVKAMDMATTTLMVGTTQSNTGDTACI